MPGPVATVMATDVPVSTFVPAGGSWVRTVPSGCAEDTTPVEVRVIPSDWACSPAAVDVIPTKLGTVTCSTGVRPGPDTSWYTTNAMARSSRSATKPAPHTSGLVPWSSSTTGGGTGATGAPAAVSEPTYASGL